MYQQSLTDWVFPADSAQGLTWAWEGSGCTDSMHVIMIHKHLDE